MSFDKKLVQIVERYELINQMLSCPSSLSLKDLTAFSKERTDLKDVAECVVKYKKLLDEIDGVRLIVENEKNDSDMLGAAKDELLRLDGERKSSYDVLRKMFLPKDEDDDKSVILEIRAGTGGEEAALFAAVLLRIYRKYAERRGWGFEVLDIAKTGLEGCKDVSVNITGRGVFARLKFESGVHRVQRIPETEASGRIHTSAATVAILPEPEEVDVQINEKDLRVDVYRSGGAGGQHVNTTDSAVRLTHIPTGIVVCQQDEKSQHKNKAKALKILRSRVYEMQRLQRDAKLSAMRRGQIGSGDRSERIRTYNFPQNRLTDHRINLTLYSLDRVVAEGALDELLDALISDDHSKMLAMDMES